MDKGKIIFDVLNEYVYNDTNEAGDKLHIIDASDLTEIIPKIVENLGLPSVSLDERREATVCLHPKEAIHIDWDGDAFCTKCETYP